MFDLEKSISEWRQQMLTAGIKTPVPLEELEIHLRESVEQQMKSGLNEQEAFNSAVQKIGRAQVLKSEFKKVEGHKMWRAILLIIGWLTAGVMLLAGTGYLNFNWNLISFIPGLDLNTIAAALIIIVAEALIWFLAKASRDYASRSVSLLICMYLAWFAIYRCLPVEQRHATSDGSAWGEAFALMLSQPSPLWYRGGLTLLVCLPGVFWLWWECRHIIQKRDSIRGNQPIPSN
jgi:hypothetical protein